MGESLKSSPILMYHQVVSERPADIHAVTVEAFASQMQWLYERGYQGVTVEELFTDCGSNRAKPNRRPIAITFDDGYLDFYTNAFPILQQYRFRATVFLVAGRIGGVNDWDKTPGLVHTPLMDWNQIRDSLESGMNFGAHTCTHLNLTKIPISQAEDEIKNSRALLEHELQKPIKVFAYPHSQYNQAVLKVVIKHGFDMACTYEPHYVGGAGKRTHELQRTGILATDTLYTFIDKVRAHPRLRFRRLWRDFRVQLKNWFSSR
jgi:peptidoglycan/xylan/chitin deacetylase (PgdA/CDA1 family)